MRSISLLLTISESLRLCVQASCSSSPKSGSGCLPERMSTPSPTIAVMRRISSARFARLPIFDFATSEAMRAKPVKTSIKCFWNVASRSGGRIIGCTSIAPLRRKSMRLKPP